MALHVSNQCSEFVPKRIQLNTVTFWYLSHKPHSFNDNNYFHDLMIGDAHSIIKTISVNASLTNLINYHLII